jgi:hypothetical protein
MEDFGVFTQLTHVVLLDCKWLVNLIVKEDLPRPAIDKLANDVNNIIKFVHSFSVERAAQYVQKLPNLHFFHETIVHAAHKLRSDVVEIVRTGLRLAVQGTVGYAAITIKNLLMHKLDLTIQACVGDLRKLLYAVKRDPFAPHRGDIPDPSSLARNALLALREWADVYTSVDTADKEAWKVAHEQRRVVLDIALNTFGETLKGCIFNILSEAHELSLLQARLEQLGINDMFCQYFAD